MKMRVSILTYVGRFSFRDHAQKSSGRPSRIAMLKHLDCLLK